MPPPPANPAAAAPDPRNVAAIGAVSGAAAVVPEERQSGRPLPAIIGEFDAAQDIIRIDRIDISARLPFVKGPERTYIET